MYSTVLPSVLQKPKGNSLSMERALKQIKSIIEELAPDGPLSDKVHASLDDLDTMLASIDRS